MTLILKPNYLTQPLANVVGAAGRGDTRARAALRKRARTEPAAKAELDLLSRK